MRYTSTPSIRMPALLTVVLAAVGCGDLTGVAPEALAGTWRAIIQAL